MISLPSFFRPHHTARVVLHHDQTTADPYENMENLASDATASARWALEELRDWSPSDFGRAKRSWELLREAVHERSTLSDTFRLSARELAEALDRMEAQQDLRPRLNSISEALLQAVELSHRVNDLIAAEAAIARARGLAD